MSDGDATFLTAGNEQGIPFHDDHDDDLGDIHVSESTRLHKKMREMKEMDDALAAKKQDYARRIKLVKQGEADFLEKQKQVIEHLRKFKQFIIETDTKRTRAERKETEERKMIEAKMKDIRRLKETLAKSIKRKNRMEAHHKRIKKNQAYLESVINKSDQYSEIEELTKRHEILYKENRALQEKSQHCADMQEAAHNKLLTHAHSKQNDILVKNSELARLLKELEDITNATSSQENDLINMEEKKKDSDRTFGEIQMAIKNIYHRICCVYPTHLNDGDSKERKRNQRRYDAAQAPLSTPALPSSGSSVSGDRADDKRKEEGTKKKFILRARGERQQKGQNFGGDNTLQHLKDLLDVVKQKLVDMEAVSIEVKADTKKGNLRNSSSNKAFPTPAAAGRW